MTYHDCLWHWGIKGMKWGVRRYQNPDGTLTAEGKRRYNDHPDYTRAHEKKSVRELSDAELNAIINRLQKEKQYNSLTATPSKMKKAVTIAGSIATALGTIGSLYNNYNNTVRIGKTILDSDAFKNAMAGTAVSVVMKAHGA